MSERRGRPVHTKKTHKYLLVRLMTGAGVPAPVPRCTDWCLHTTCMLQSCGPADPPVLIVLGSAPPMTNGSLP